MVDGYYIVNILKLNYMMKWISIVFTILVCVFYWSLNANAQSVKKVEARVLDDIIVVSYDLTGNDDLEFTVNLYSSKDNFKMPLTLVTGDVGSNIQAGNGKRIEWLAKNELGDYQGSLIFEIRAFLPEAAFDPLELVNFKLKEIKKGQSYKVQWKGGKSNEKIDIMLFEDGKEKSRIAQVENSGEYLFKIPKGNKNSNYRIQLDGESGTIGSSQFKIIPGISPLLIGGGAVLVGGIVAVIVWLGSDGGGSTDQPNNLPEPPNPN